MPAKGKGRSKKAAVVNAIEGKTQENVVDQKNVNDEDAPAVTTNNANKRGTTRRNQAKANNDLLKNGEAGESSAVPEKRSRGKTTNKVEPSKEEVIPVSTNSNAKKTPEKKLPPTKVSKGGKRGGKKVVEQDEISNEPEEKSNDAKQDTEEEPEPESKSASNSSDIDEDKPTQIKRSRKKGASETPAVSTKVTKEKETILPAEPLKKGRGGSGRAAKKEAAEKIENGFQENKKAVKTAAAKKTVSGGRSRKRAAAPEIHEEQNGNEMSEV